MASRIADRKLTANQRQALERAQFHLPWPHNFPHGIYRSLVIRGLLRPAKGGYEITPNGAAAIARQK